jgi:hypothetical protein
MKDEIKKALTEALLEICYDQEEFDLKHALHQAELLLSYSGKDDDPAPILDAVVLLKRYADKIKENHLVFFRKRYYLGCSLVAPGFGPCEILSDAWEKKAISKIARGEVTSIPYKHGRLNWGNRYQIHFHAFFQYSSLSDYETRYLKSHYRQTYQKGEHWLTAQKKIARQIDKLPNLHPFYDPSKGLIYFLKKEHDPSEKSFSNEEWLALGGRGLLTDPSHGYAFLIFNPLYPLKKELIEEIESLLIFLFLSESHDAVEMNHKKEVQAKKDAKAKNEKIPAKSSSKKAFASTKKESIRLSPLKIKRYQVTPED